MSVNIGITEPSIDEQLKELDEIESIELQNTHNDFVISDEQHIQLQPINDIELELGVTSIKQLQIKSQEIKEFWKAMEKP